MRNGKSLKKEMQNLLVNDFLIKRLDENGRLNAHNIARFIGIRIRTRKAMTKGFIEIERTK